MRHSESQAATLYVQHAALMEELADNPFNKESVKEFSQEVKLTTLQKALITASTTGQRIVDALTFGLPHCTVSQEPKPCKVYTQSILLAANQRHKALTAIGMKPGKESLLFGETYTTTDHILKTATLLIESLVVILAIQHFPRKK